MLAWAPVHLRTNDDYLIREAITVLRERGYKQVNGASLPPAGSLIYRVGSTTDRRGNPLLLVEWWERRVV